MTDVSIKEKICLQVDVPICAFRPFESREYQDTHPAPPPSAVYGMLLSFCGVRRENKARHLGVQMALAVEEPPERAKVFRKLRRGKELGDIRPDYQDLLIGLKLWVWLQRGDDSADPPLCERVYETIKQAESIDRYGGRFGGLSLGESSYLVDAINLRQPDRSQSLRFLKPDRVGFYNLPLWVDHSSNKHVRQRFAIETMAIEDALRSCWISITEDDPNGAAS